MEGYKVKHGEGKEILIQEVEDNLFKVNEEQLSLDIADLGKGRFHILKNNKSFNAELVEIDRVKKQFTIKVNNTTYELELEDKYDMLLQKLGMDAIGASAVSDLLAPMPGLVLSTAVSAGDTVKKDDPLVVLEAMKMENVLKSPIDGVIKEVSVNSGDTVEKNQTLIIFES